ncbi:MAG TPA: PIN domain-containing protein [bacterium]|nr:PIN domain-containing protein [bacterium]
MDKKRILIPDTNIFINDPNSIYAFPNEIIKIPLEVIEEVDDQKRRSDDVGRNARQTSRILDNLRTVNGSLSDGVTLENGCNVSVEFGDKPMSSLPASLRSNKEDNRILATALSIQDKNPDNLCVFVTLDINMRIKAEAIGLVTIDYEPGKIQFEELYKGYAEKEASASQMDELAANGKLVLAEPMRPHELVSLSCAENGKTAYGRFDAEAGAIVPLKHSYEAVVSGIKPLNIEQLFAFELLIDDSISLVTLNGEPEQEKR